MKTTKYTRENLSSLNGTAYTTGHINSARMLINNGVCTVDGRTYASLNAALNRICELEHRCKNSLRAKHMWNEDGWTTLEEDIKAVMEEEAVHKEKDEKEYERADKINKIADTEINLVKDLFGIDVPTNVKNAYVKILDGIFDIIPSVF